MLLAPKTINRLERMRFNPRQRLTSRHRGDHLRGRGGSSTEFSDYRDYSPGDDTRFIDWNIFSRLQRPYLKLFHLEEEMNAVIILDASKSMAFENKFEMAQKMAAALSVVGLHSNEKVSLYIIQNKELSVPEHISPSSGRFHKNAFFKSIESVQAGGSLQLNDGIDKVVKHHKGKGLAFVISDFMTIGDMGKAFNLLFSNGLAPYALQILAPSELNPELNGDIRFVDSESAATLDISAVGSLTEIYHEYLTNLQTNLSEQCQKRSGLYMCTSSDADPEDVLLNTMVRRGWIK